MTVRTLSSDILHFCSKFSLNISFCVHRLLVERVFAQYMVPHNLETTERMKCLYYLYATLDTNAVKYVFLTRIRSKTVEKHDLQFSVLFVCKKIK